MKVKIEKWLKNNCSNLEGKLVAITGSTGDIGKEVCYFLAKLNAKLLFLNRSRTKTEKLKVELLKQFPDLEINEVIMDLENFSSVKKALKEIDEYQIDFLILNAGAYKIERRKSDVGYENVYQINFLSQYYLTRKIVEKMELRKEGKVVAVSSVAHNFSKIDSNDIDFSTRKSISKVYGNSKRYLMYSMYELFENSQYVKLSVVHPGITYTNMTLHHNKVIYCIIKYPMKLLFPKPKKATLSIIKGLYDECRYHEWIGPGIFNIWGYPKKRKIYTCSIEESNQIHMIAEEMYRKLR